MKSAAASDHIRVGDFVRIVDPRIFVRCGYPLSLSDVAAQIEPAVIFDFLSRAGAGTLEDICRTITHYPHHRLQRAYKEAARAGALAVMIARRFGGSELTDTGVEGVTAEMGKRVKEILDEYSA